MRSAEITQFKYFSNLQVLRGIAAVLVTVHHSFTQFATGSTDPAFLAGARGVDIFFVISGFVIYLTARKAPSAVDFMLMRFVRIVPLYWGACFALVVLHVLAPGLFRTTVVTSETFLQSILFIPHWSLAFPDMIYPILVPGWSLNYEMMFYALVAFGLVLAPREIFSFLLSILGGLIILGAAIDTRSAGLLTYTNPLLLEFAAGVVLAKFAISGGFSGRLSAVGCIPLGAVLLLSGGDLYFTQIGVAAALVGAPLFVAGFLALEFNGWAIRGRLWRLLGDASYSVYLSHIFTLGALRVVWKHSVGASFGELSVAAFVILALITCSAVGVLVHRYIEKPLLAWCGHWVRQARLPSERQTS